MNKKIMAFLFTFICVWMLSSQQMSLTEIKKLPHKNIRFYNGSISNNVNEKIQNASINVLKYLCEIDGNKKYKNHVLSGNEKNLFFEYYSFLPESYKKVISDKVYAIYFIDGLSYGGMADYIFDDNNNMYCILFLNSKVLQKNLSEWLEERDNSPFKSVNKSNKIVVKCSSVYKGLLHTLVHESSHIYDYFNHITPYTEPNLKELGVGTTEFVNVWEEYYLSKEQYRNDQIRNVSFWGFGNKISITNASAIIKYIVNSPFSSVYGAKNWADDFAETYTFYYLKKKFNIEYEILYMENGKIIQSYIPTNNILVKQRYSLFSNIE
jgi:hypothetical protein